MPIHSAPKAATALRRAGLWVSRYLLSAVFTAAVIFGIAGVVSQEQASLAERVDRNTQATIYELRHMQALLCTVLEPSEDPVIRDAVAEHCDAVLPKEP